MQYLVVCKTAGGIVNIKVVHIILKPTYSKLNKLKLFSFITKNRYNIGLLKLWVHIKILLASHSIE